MEQETVKTRWGRYTVLTHSKKEGFESKSKILNVAPDKNLSYQRHLKREEYWLVLNGSGTIIADGIFHLVAKGDSIYIPYSSWHVMKAGEQGLDIMEIQVGHECTEEDIERSHYDWNDITSWVRGEQVDG